MGINEGSAFILKTEMGLNFEKRWSSMSQRQKRRFDLVMKDRWCI